MAPAHEDVPQNPPERAEIDQGQKSTITFGDDEYSMEQFSARLIADIAYIRAHVEAVESQQKKVLDRLDALEDELGAVRRRNAAMDAGGCPFIQQLRNEVTSTERDIITQKARDETADKFWGWLRPLIISAATSLIVAVLTLMLANAGLFLKASPQQAPAAQEKR